MYVNNTYALINQGGLNGLGSYDDNGNWTDEGSTWLHDLANDPRLAGPTQSTGFNWNQLTADLLRTTVNTASQVAIIGAVPTNTAVTPQGIFRNSGIQLPMFGNNTVSGIGSGTLLLIGGGLLLVMMMKR